MDYFSLSSPFANLIWSIWVCHPCRNIPDSELIDEPCGSCNSRLTVERIEAISFDEARLIQISRWNEENVNPIQYYHCSNCMNPDIEMQLWVNPNTNERIDIHIDVQHAWCSYCQWNNEISISELPLAVNMEEAMEIARRLFREGRNAIPR